MTMNEQSFSPSESKISIAAWEIFFAQLGESRSRARVGNASISCFTEIFRDSAFSQLLRNTADEQIVIGSLQGAGDEFTAMNNVERC